MKSLESYLPYIQKAIDEHLQNPDFAEPAGLYEPCKYILQNGGKRVRASLVLMATKLFSGEFEKALPVALAFETFHNFTLIHDDIMDKASIRRGIPTVHVKWDENTAILSGDAVMIIAYRFFEESGEYVPQLFKLLNKTALEVCEGQQYDVDLEKSSLDDSFVSEEMYIKMIELKTSVLLAACLNAGAIVGGASKEDEKKMYEIGRQIGIAFQLQDDLLDTYGNQKTFGKKIGGDIQVNKKTYLLIKALETLQGKDKDQLINLMQTNSLEESDKYSKVVALYDKANVKKQTIDKIQEYFKNAMSLVDSIQLPDERKGELTAFMNELVNRNY
ncbi:MAG: polyprenyl synthetase family protein [Bacteroidales bacterium]|nr:polyprenyl synthetase family protein [Bacteroidales bacterium]